MSEPPTAAGEPRAAPLVRLFKHTLIYGLGNILQKFLSILLLPIYTRYLEPADYGITGLLGVFGMVLGALTLCGVPNAISRYFYYAREEGTSRDAVVWSPFSFVSVFAGVTVAVAALAAEPISRFLFDTPEHAYLVRLALAGVWINDLAGIGRSILVLEERAYLINAINIGGVIVGVTSGLVFVVALGRGVTGVVESSLCASACMAVPILALSVFRFRPSFSLPLLARQLRFSLPLVAAIYAFWFIDFSDRYLLKEFLPLGEVGLYTVGYTLGMVMLVVVDGFSQAWPPYYHRNNRDGEGQRVCNEALRLYLLGSCACAVLLSAGAPLAVKLLTAPEFHTAYTVVPWVAAAYMLKGPYIIFLIGVQMKDRTSWQLGLEVAVAAANVAGNVLLIPLVGREGAAVTTFISYALLVAGAGIMVMRINPIPHLELRRPALLAAAACGASIGAVWLARATERPVTAGMLAVLAYTVVTGRQYLELARSYLARRRGRIALAASPAAKRGDGTWEGEAPAEPQG